MVSFYPKFIHEKFHFLGGGSIFLAKKRVFCVILTTKSSLDLAPASQMCVETKSIEFYIDLMVS